jgi:hypothetical protein
MSALADSLNRIGIFAEDLPGGFVKLPGYEVHLGRHKGEIVDVAIVGVDFPLTPPAGVHIGAAWGADRQNVNPSPLGESWRYFSRRHPDWSGRNLLHVLLAYINRVLGDA